MDKKSSILVGGVLVILGLLSLMFLGVISALGVDLFGFIWRLWPMFIIGVGLFFVVPPFLVRGKPGLGALLIPGMPVLTTGGLLFLGSVFDAWGIWEWLWPMELISLAMGFLLAAIYMKVIWLLIPAMIIGLNGFTFQFCAITDLWEWWAFLWTIEPLSVGLALLVIGLRRQSPGLKTAGLILCGIAGAGLADAHPRAGAAHPGRFRCDRLGAATSLVLAPVGAGVNTPFVDLSEWLAGDSGPLFRISGLRLRELSPVFHRPGTCGTIPAPDLVPGRFYGDHSFSQAQPSLLPQLASSLSWWLLPVSSRFF